MNNVIKLELISSSGCKKCEHARGELRAIAREVAEDRLVWREVNVLDELDYAVGLGVLTLPSVAINGKLAFAGLPTAEQLRAELAKYL